MVAAFLRETQSAKGLLPDAPLTKTACGVVRTLLGLNEQNAGLEGPAVAGFTGLYDSSLHFEALQVDTTIHAKALVQAANHALDCSQLL
jgi:hypothetical protein